MGSDETSRRSSGPAGHRGHSDAILSVSTSKQALEREAVMFGNAQTTAATARQDEGATDAENAVLHLAEVMDGLKGVLEEETALVRAGRLRQATGLALRKTELASHYVKAAEQLKARARLLSRSLPQEVGALGRRHDELQAALKSNLIVLATAHAVSEGIVRRLSGDLARKASPQVYGASGRTAAPNPRLARPLALSRTL
jgi:hypothetical protein